MSFMMKSPVEQSGTPPSPYTEGSQPSKTSRRWIWITVSIVALVSIFGIALFAWLASWAIVAYSNSPLHDSDTYYSAIKAQDYSTAYTYLDSRLQLRQSQQAFTQAAQEQDQALGRVSRFEMLTIPTGNPADVRLRVTRTNGATYEVHLTWRQERGIWKISAFDHF